MAGRVQMWPADKQKVYKKLSPTQSKRRKKGCKSERQAEREEMKVNQGSLKLNQNETD